MFCCLSKLRNFTLQNLMEDCINKIMLLAANKYLHGKVPGKKVLHGAQKHRSKTINSAAPTVKLKNLR